MSDGWLLERAFEGKQQEVKGGDESCFLFNLTDNLRFNAVKGKDYYFHAKENEIRFGNSDLVIRDHFGNVTSDIRQPKEKAAFNQMTGPDSVSGKSTRYH